MTDWRSNPGTPALASHDETSPETPTSSPVSTSLKSPGLTSSSTNASRTPSFAHQPSPLLLAVDELTPLNSRDEDSALYSDSDVASQSSATATVRGRRDSSDDMRKSKKRNPSRRRRSDATERSTTRSLRSHSAHRDIRYPHATKIFRNLLILEQGLRDQYREQKSLRNRFTFFLAALAGIEAFTIYSLYSVVPGPVPPMVLKFIAFFILVTLALFHLSGEYRRTIVIPRRFFTSTNKGLRQLNLRLVKNKEPLGDRFSDLVRSGLRVYVHSSQWCVDKTGSLKNLVILAWWSELLRSLEIRAQPRVGAFDVKLMMNPRAFNAEIREAWEMYRDEFWAREGSRLRHVSEKDEKDRTKSVSAGATGNVLDRESLLEKHRKERKDRRRSKAIDDKAQATSQEARRSGISSSPSMSAGQE
ncbi:Sporulation-specific protein SPO7 [Cyberlindnera fabianii]|uniref:Sporulation-specific protein SPO7 n=1 Tax=Cyberlindnera fabianii TaxID=36022 RepID=A0A1V2L8V2_CYBFA|nr:Sporulation-specific protein SPO7 [Cyberlindnera fabianii]